MILWIHYQAHLTTNPTSVSAWTIKKGFIGFVLLFQIKLQRFDFEQNLWIEPNALVMR
mgnify:CR=1 FL=1